MDGGNIMVTLSLNDLSFFHSLDFLDFQMQSLKHAQLEEQVPSPTLFIIMYNCRHNIQGALVQFGCYQDRPRHECYSPIHV